MSKVFDSVWHVGLLDKLKSYGGSGQVCGLTLSFLMNRQLQVVQDRKSLQEYLGANVFQSSIVGCTLFPAIH